MTHEQPDDARGQVEVLPEYGQGLCDLEGFERIWLPYICHRSAPPSLEVVPYLDRRLRAVSPVCRVTCRW